VVLRLAADGKPLPKAFSLGVRFGSAWAMGPVRSRGATHSGWGADGHQGQNDPCECLHDVRLPILLLRFTSGVLVEIPHHGERRIRQGS
jgi:hypothetical protein